MSEQLLQQILSELQSLNQRVSNLELKQDGTEQMIRALRYGQEEMKAQLHSLTHDVAHIQGDITALKENQEKIISIQQNQQKILERLSIRSISQEADIAELRRIK